MCFPFLRVRHEQASGGAPLPAGQSPAVGGAGSGLSQKADRAWPGTPHSCDRARRNGPTEPGPALPADRAGVLSVKVLKPWSLLKLSPQSRGPKNYSGPQSHTFISLHIESRVLSPDQSRSQVPMPRLQRPER